MTPHFCKTRKELAFLLVSRGMVSSAGISADELQREMCCQLSRVNYYRLSAYWCQFLRTLDETQPMKRTKDFRPRHLLGAGRGGKVSAVSLLHRVRNEFAHQGRVWNRHRLQFMPHGGTAPVLKTPDRRSWTYQISKQDEWQLAEDVPDCLLQSPVCTAAALTVCSVMLRAIAPRCDWRKRLFSLFSDCGIPAIHQEVGFAHADWQKHPLWSEEAAY